MRTIFAEYNPHRNSIDVYTSAGYVRHTQKRAPPGAKIIPKNSKIFEDYF